MHNDPDTQLVGTAEAAQILGKDVSTVARWVRLKKLSPVAKLPGLTGARLFNRSDVEALKAAS